MSAHLLHLDASPRSQSHSRAVGRAFADEWRRNGGGYTYRDLAADPLPHITAGHTELSEAAGIGGLTDAAGLADLPRTDAQRAAWAVSAPLIAELQAADVVLIGTPMYNFGIPSGLKSWIDLVTFAGVKLGPGVGVVAAARGGAYGPGAPREPFDFQERYLRAYLTAYGPTDVRFLTTELTLAPVMPPMADLVDAHESSRAAALEAARTLARDLVADPTPAAA
ncbi:MAG TPA: NAD(P)H-dependent oxidoreductase [Actinocatenispora sp.]